MARVTAIAKRRSETRQGTSNQVGNRGQHRNAGVDSVTRIIGKVKAQDAIGRQQIGRHKHHLPGHAWIGHSFDRREGRR